MRYLRCFLIIVLVSCSHQSEVKINLYAKKVMDIEVPVKNVLPYCSIPADPERKNSWLGIYVFHGEKIERISEKHQHLPKDCEEERKEIEKLLARSQRARVIAIDGRDEFEDTELKHFIKLPASKKVKAQWWTFSRIITEKGCFGWDGCEDPKLIEKDYYSNIYE